MIEEQLEINQVLTSQNQPISTQDLAQTIQLPKQKKKKNKKKKKVDQEEVTDFEGEWWIKWKQSKIFQVEHLDHTSKERLAQIETNPYMVIVSNISLQLNINDIEEYFVSLIQNLNPKISSNPIKLCQYGLVKSWAVLECSTQEAKNTLKALPELEFRGCHLKIEKPFRFIKRMYIQQDHLKNDIYNLHDDTIRLYLGGIPSYLKDDDVKKLVAAFGPIKYFNLVKDSTTELQSKGYCFFEYEENKYVERAMNQLNGLPIADKRLKVSKVTIPQPLRNPMQPSNHCGSFLGSCELVGDPEVQLMLTVPQQAFIPSRVIQLLNMISVEDLFEDDIYEELIEDVRSECCKYGQIDRIEIPRPDKKSGVCNSAVGKVLVKYVYQIPAKKARYHLSGRTYNKRTVIGSFYPEDRFDLKDYLIYG